MLTLKRSLTLLILSLTFISCGPDAPKLTVCIMRTSDIKCQDPSGKQFVLGFADARGYWMMHPSDAQKGFEYVSNLEKRVANCK